MTTVTISPVKDASGGAVMAYVTVVLVDATQTHRVGWQVSTGGPIAEYRNVRLYDTTLSLSLVPQSDLAIDPEASPTWYLVTISTGNRDEPYLVQVPVSLTPVNLLSLIGASAIGSGSAPFPVPEAPLTAGPYARKTAAWVDIFAGFDTIAVVDSFPPVEVAGVLYLSKTAP